MERRRRRVFTTSGMESSVGSETTEAITLCLCST